MRRMPVVAVLALALAGCTTMHAPAPGLSDDERAAVQEWQRDSLWASYGLADSERPPPPDIVLVNPDDFAVEYVRCMNDAGFDNYTASGSGYTIEASESQSAADLHSEQVADYVCNARLWPANDAGWHSEAEMTYLYDYFDEVLIPCLAAHDISIFQAPTRQDFFDQFGWWHPYGAVREADQNALFSDRQMLVECPPLPAGIPDPGYASYWDYWAAQ
jgi:hypothetical protein